jgi:three-Cys-motif partner protein
VSSTDASGASTPRLSRRSLKALFAASGGGGILSGFVSPTDGNHFFEEQSETSRRKIEVYGKYLKPLSYKILSRYKRLWIVDAYAGAGAYDPDAEGNRAAGSPLIAANFARQHNVNSAKAGKEIRLINVEAHPERFARLEETLMGFRPDVTNLRGRFQDHLDDILQTIGSDPVLFFIDPFGMEGADIRIIERILERRSRTVTELLINFSDRGFLRMAGNLDAKAKRPQDLAAAQTKVKTLDAILGTSFWQGAWRNPDLSTEEKLEQVAALYADQLRACGIDFVNGVQMRDAWDGPTAYRLVFATRSAHGVYLMSDIVARYERELFDTRFEGSFDLVWAAEKQAEEKAALRTEIHEFGLARGDATPLQVFLHFGPICFGKWTQTDYMACLRELVALGGIERANAVGIKQREQLRFIPLAQVDLFSGTGT